MTPEPALDSSSDRVDAYNLRGYRDRAPAPPPPLLCICAAVLVVYLRGRSGHVPALSS